MRSQLSLSPGCSAGGALLQAQRDRLRRPRDLAFGGEVVPPDVGDRGVRSDAAGLRRRTRTLQQPDCNRSRAASRSQPIQLSRQASRMTGLASMAMPITGRRGRAALRTRQHLTAWNRPVFVRPSVPEVAPDVDQRQSRVGAFGAGLADLDHRIDHSGQRAFTRRPRQAVSRSEVRARAPAPSSIRSRTEERPGWSERATLHSCKELPDRRFAEVGADEQPEARRAPAPSRPRCFAGLAGDARAAEGDPPMADVDAPPCSQRSATRRQIAAQLQAVAVVHVAPGERTQLVREARRAEALRPEAGRRNCFRSPARGRVKSRCFPGPKILVRRHPFLQNRAGPRSRPVDGMADNGPRR